MLFRSGFANFESKTILSNQDLENHIVKIKNTNKTIALKVEKEYSVICNKNEELNYQLNFNLPHQMREIKINEIIGNVEIVVDGVIVERINILSCENYFEPTIWDNFKEIIKNY